MNISQTMNKLEQLRHLFDAYQISAYLVPQTDEFQGEHIAPYAQRLHWLTGFTGTAGLAVVTKYKAALFVDARYILQAQNEVSLSDFEVINARSPKMQTWLEENVKDGLIGYDPWLHTRAEQERYKGFHLKETPNLIDLLWKDQPAFPTRQFVVHPLEYAGQPHSSKVKDFISYLEKNDIDAYILTDTTSIAWLLNVRGSDIPYTPVTLAYSIIHRDKVVVYANEKQSPEVLKHFNSQIQLRPFERFLADLQNLSGLKIGFSPEITPCKILETLSKNNILKVQEDPCISKRAIKNPIEQQGMRHAHLRDSVALTKFMYWFENFPCPDEYSAVEKLVELRRQQPLFQGLSFETIAAFGENGAVVHYRPNARLTRAIDKDGLLLVDSGGQYLDGTTDVTRVLLKGTPQEEHIRHYSLVLKGYINLSRAKFPCGVSGPQLDVLARMPLWQEGKDFAHATGHGVGSYLNVHEGPHYIGQTMRFTAPLEPGMVVTNEPGYYQTGAFGIRIETLLLVIPDPQWGPHYLSFETLTLVPLEPKLIDTNLLNSEERDWLNTYHQHVAERLMPYMTPEEKTWLIEKTRPLSPA